MAQSKSVTKTIRLNSDAEAGRLFGSLDEHLRYAETEFHVHIAARNSRLSIRGAGASVQRALEFFNQKLSAIRKKSAPDSSSAPPERPHPEAAPCEESFGEVQFYHKGKQIRPKSRRQAQYLEAMNAYDIVIGIGPAGTGKTYLAVAQAVECLKKRKAGRIILTRPAVEAGESLGFLPGDLSAKINPYLRPLYDALYDMLDVDEVTRYVERGIIEIAPLAYMRGRTLNDSFIILDEGQNTTHEQMKMFLTRLGRETKLVITGDITQVDLPAGKKSGLIECQKILKSIRGIHFSYLSENDIVRHPLVKEIVRAYDRYIP